MARCRLPLAVWNPRAVVALPVAVPLRLLARATCAVLRHDFKLPGQGARASESVGVARADSDPWCNCPTADCPTAVGQLHTDQANRP